MTTRTPTDTEVPWLGDDPWYVAIWPDGTYTNWEDRYEYLQAFGDDYAKHKVVTFDANSYCPLHTELVNIGAPR